MCENNFQKFLKNFYESRIEKVEILVQMLGKGIRFFLIVKRADIQKFIRN
jgi:hypothetical protein